MDDLRLESSWSSHRALKHSSLHSMAKQTGERGADRIPGFGFGFLRALEGSRERREGLGSNEGEGKPPWSTVERFFLPLGRIAPTRDPVNRSAGPSANGKSFEKENIKKAAQATR